MVTLSAFVTTQAPVDFSDGQTFQEGELLISKQLDQIKELSPVIPKSLLAEINELYGNMWPSLVQPS